MRLYFLQIHPFCRISVEDLTDEVGSLAAQVKRELDINLQDPIISLTLIFFALKRGSSGTELIAEHPEAPDVSPFIIKIPSNNLRRYVIQSPTEGLSLTA